MKKVFAILVAAIVGWTLMFGAISEAKGGGGSRPAASSRPSVSTSKAPKTSVPAPKGNTSGYGKLSESSTPPKGSSSTTNGGGKVTSGGGNTSGYKSKQEQTKEEAQENMAKKDKSSNSGSSSWYGGTNSHYYNGYNGGLGHFATGMLFGSLLSSPWHVYAGAPGYVGAYGEPGMAAGGFYSPFSGIIGVIIWIIEWAVIIGLLVGLYFFARKWWKSHGKTK